MSGSKLQVRNVKASRPRLWSNDGAGGGTRHVLSEARRLPPNPKTPPSTLATKPPRLTTNPARQTPPNIARCRSDPPPRHHQAPSSRPPYQLPPASFGTTLGHSVQEHYSQVVLGRPNTYHSQDTRGGVTAVRTRLSTINRNGFKHYH